MAFYNPNTNRVYINGGQNIVASRFLLLCVETAQVYEFWMSHCRERRFVLSFFMADDSLAIFEPPLKNSGVVGGKYLERRQVTHPASTR